MQIKTRHTGIALPFAALCLSACTSMNTNTTSPPYGETKDSAIEVCQPAGEIAYLQRLRCPGGESVKFKRIGNVGLRNEVPASLSEAERTAAFEKMMRGDTLAHGEVDFHIIDKYAVVCGEASRIVYLDMYHCHQPTPAFAPAGYTFKTDR